VNKEFHPHQQRVIDEKAELDARIAALTAFINGDVFMTLDDMDAELLCDQALAMGVYSTVLGKRIARF
jgi:hypothetical protein